jgi:hypothetical protein
MALRQVLVERRSLCRVAVRAGLVRAIDDPRETRLDDRGRAGPSDCSVAATVGYQRLAMRVIQRAFKDMIAPACAAGDRESARRFLAGSPMLLLWCSVAALDSRSVIVRANALRSRSPVGG